MLYDYQWLFVCILALPVLLNIVLPFAVMIVSIVHKLVAKRRPFATRGPVSLNQAPMATS